MGAYGWDIVILATLSAIGVLAVSANAYPSVIQYAQLTIQQRVIIRVPTRMVPAAPPVTRWRFKSYKKCIGGRGLAGAVLAAPDKVDLILPGGDRIRAELESSCPALDYYNGFYLRPDADGMICAGRDAIHARSGGECQIARFRKMVPVR